MSLFSTSSNIKAPLAERVRPKNLEDVKGQDHLLGEEGVLVKALAHGQLFSMIFWGPPGTGKTTTAHLLAAKVKARFVTFSAVTSGIKEVKEVMEESKQRLHLTGEKTLLFVDEIHRFNRSQQDAFLPFIERGDLILVGATTENPSFELNNALLSRTRVFILELLSADTLFEILKNALHSDSIVRAYADQIPEEAVRFIAERSAGDARSALNLLEQCIFTLKSAEILTPEKITQILQKPILPYDKTSEEHYNTISALHKSIRNSDVQAALYWLGRMLESGEDPLYVVRRLVRFASEDIGNADPRALMLAIACKDSVEFLGLPECKVGIAQLVIYMSAAPKSNSAYLAYENVENTLKQGKVYPVPMEVRNAPTKFMKNVGYGKGYQYAHDDPRGVSNLQCLPKELKNEIFYTPIASGHEAKMKEQFIELQKRLTIRNNLDKSKK